MGKAAIYILDPSYVKNCAPEDLHLGRGVETARHTSPCTPLRTPAPYSTDRGVGGGKNC